MARIAIIGSGVVGQAAGKVLVEEGNDVLFVDIDETKIAALEKEGYRAGKWEVLQDGTVDIFFLTVPTPTPSPQQGISLEYIEEAAWMLGKGPLRRLDNYPIVVVKSTVPPGTTRKFVTPLLERSSSKRAGKDFGVAAEPEYLREKAALKDAHAPHLIVIGTEDERAMASMTGLRLPLHRPIIRVKPEEAELQKYIHNLWNATKISFFNEMRSVCKALHTEEGCEEVFVLAVETAEATWNHRYGTRDFGPFGGTCLPKDTSAFLRWSQNELALPLPLLRSVIAVNENLKAEEAREAKKRAEKRRLFASFNISGERRTTPRPLSQESFSF